MFALISVFRSSFLLLLIFRCLLAQLFQHLFCFKFGKEIAVGCVGVAAVCLFCGRNLTVGMQPSTNSGSLRRQWALHWEKSLLLSSGMCSYFFSLSVLLSGVQVSPKFLSYCLGESSRTDRSSTDSFRMDKYVGCAYVYRNYFFKYRLLKSCSIYNRSQCNISVS